MNHSVRVEDYINDKLQTYADLATIDSLLASVQSQHSLLAEQLQDAEAHLKSTQDAASARAADTHRKAETFQKQQADIDTRLMIITQSDTTDDAVERFDASMARLRKLELAEQYIGMLQEVDRLEHAPIPISCEYMAANTLAFRRAATEQYSESPDAALATFNELRQLSRALGPLQDRAEGAAPHMVDFVDKTVASLRQKLRNAFAKDFEAVLSKILWPKKSMVLPQSLLESFNKAVGKLLLLQKPELEEQQDGQPSYTSADSAVPLLPLEVMVEPIALRFRYHFSGEKPTNRLDKPEYFFSHFFEVLNDHVDFVNEYIQPILLAHFKDSPLMLNMSLIDASSNFVTALLPMVRSKVFAIVPQMSHQPQLLSHLMHELMSFDTTLRNDWRYTGGASGDVPEPWKGLTGEVLAQHQYFDDWLRVEKDFALARYQAIVDDPNAFMLDYDSVSSIATKPTNAAIRVHDLLSTITTTYRPLASFSQKLRFLMDIQITIFDRFHARLRSALDAYITKTSSIGRTVQGLSAADTADVQGTAGYDRLCRVFGSAEYLEVAMRDWSDDIFFLDLWSELQERARTRDTGSVAGHLSVNDVASRTSSTLQASADGDDDAGSGALFDETAAAYASLRDRAENVLTDALKYNVRESLRPYAKNSGFATTSSLAASDLTPSSDLSGTLSILSTGLAFLAKALGPLPLRRIAKATARTMDEFIFDRVLLAHDFTESGAQQATVDLKTIFTAFERHVGTDAGEGGLSRCKEAVRLLNLGAQENTATDDETNAWEDGNDDNARADEPSPSLWTVEKRLFASNEEARKVLAQLDMSTLTENEARKVLRCRVELGS